MRFTDTDAGIHIGRHAALLQSFDAAAVVLFQRVHVSSADISDHIHRAVAGGFRNGHAVDHVMEFIQLVTSHVHDLFQRGACSFGMRHNGDLSQMDTLRNLSRQRFDIADGHSRFLDKRELADRFHDFYGTDACLIQIGVGREFQID